MLGATAGKVCCTRFSEKYFKYVSCEFDQLSGRYRVLAVERSRFNVARCVMNQFRGKYIHRSNRVQGRREERGPGRYGMVGTPENDDTEAVRTRYEVV